jgi:RHS repeat-associated protein
MKLRFLTTLALVLTTGATFAQVPYAGNDADSGVTRASEFLDPYTGNLAFSTRDLIVAGAVGERGLSWARCTTSRTSQKEPLFGLGHNWAHNWQWEMVDAGQDSQGRAMLSVRLPGGWVHPFTQTSPGQWWPTPAEKHRVVSNGDSFIVLHQDGGEVRFTRSHTTQGDTYTLNEISDAVGNVSKLTWENGRLVQVTEPAGRWLKISYISLSAPNAAVGVKPYTVIAKVVASDGQVVSYDYAFPAGADYPVLAKVAYPDGTSASYTYAAPRAGTRVLLTQVDDPRADSSVRGRSFRYYGNPDAAVGQTMEVRTADGSAVLQSVAADPRNARTYAAKQDNGVTVYRTYNPGGNVAADIDALGFSAKTSYDVGGRGFKISSTDKLGKVTQFVKDANGYVIKQTAPDGTSKTWQRDARGRVLAETNELGQTRTYTRDAQGRVTKVQLPDGSAEEMSYNALGQVQTVKVRSGAVTVVAYDDRGLRTKVTNTLGQAVALAYDDHDRLAAVNDPLGNTTSFARDAAGRIAKVAHADGTSANVEYNSFGQITKSTDATGVARTYVYDNLGRPTSVFNGAGGETRMEYAPVGSGVAPLGKPTRVVSPEGRATALTYDANGRVTARTAAAGTNLVATTRTAYDAAGRQTSVTDALGNTTQMFYDGLGRRTKVMNALNHATTSTYDAAGHKLSQTDAKGNTTKWTYDAMGRVLTTIDAKNQVTQFQYNTAGQRIALVDAKGNTYHFEYDPLGRQTAMVYPDGSRETTAYDAAGNKLSTTNRAGITQSFTYNNLNREIASEWSDGSQKIVKAYDAAGRMTLEDNGISKLTYAFDNAGRFLSETQDLSPVVTGGGLDPAPRTVSYSYTADGQRDSLTYPDGSFVKYTYNARGQLQDILGDGVPPPIASYEYDVAGNATLMPRENQTETAFNYDATNQVTEITDRNSNSHRSPLSELDYTYDEVGNRSSTTQAFNADGKGRDENTKDTYSYDATYQVTGADYAAPVAGAGGPSKDGDDNDRGDHGNSATSTSNLNSNPPQSVRFVYDAVGNRVQVTADGQITRYTANNLNQYTQVGEFKPTYDRNGNLAGMGQWLYTYDALNRLVSASDGQTTARFFYDAKNRCVARSYRATSTSTVNLNLNYYDNWNLIEERDASGKQLARYIHGRQVDEIVAMVNQHGVYYPHRDVQGNVTFLTDVSGNLVERYKYTVEGQVTITDAKGQELVRSAVGNRWMYTGREWLAEVGLYDYRNRVYSAQLGRFLQTDPIRLAAGDVNIYRYCSNNVINGTDPLGLWDAWDTFELTVVTVGELVVGELTAPAVVVAAVAIEVKDEVQGWVNDLSNSIDGIASTGTFSPYANPVPADVQNLPSNPPPATCLTLTDGNTTYFFYGDCTIIVGPIE